MSSKWVRVGSVRRSSRSECGEVAALALRLTSALASVAWEDWSESPTDENREELVGSCAEAVRAAVDLASTMGVDDLRPWIKESERIDKMVGLITDGRSG